MEGKCSSEQKTKIVKGKISKNKKIEIISINQPSKEDSKIKIKELSDFLSMAWAQPDKSE